MEQNNASQCNSFIKSTVRLLSDSPFGVALDGRRRRVSRILVRAQDRRRGLGSLPHWNFEGRSLLSVVVDGAALPGLDAEVALAEFVVLLRNSLVFHLQQLDLFQSLEVLLMLSVELVRVRENDVLLLLVFRVSILELL